MDGKNNNRTMKNGCIRVALAGVGNCSGSLVEGIQFYRNHKEATTSLLFPILGGYQIFDIEFVVAFDISAEKVDEPIYKAIYKRPNNFARNGKLQTFTNASGFVFRGPTLDGNPSHLAKLVSESSKEPDDVVSLLKRYQVDVLLNLLPTGSHEATMFYANAAASANCGFINCIPSIIAQDNNFQMLFKNKELPLFGDDIKSQVGTTILHRALLYMLQFRGAKVTQTAQINVGGNTDFLNFIHRAESKLISKRKSLKKYIDGENVHIGHHFDKTRGSYKTAFIDIEADVFAGSSLKISLRLESDDKPNAAGSISDLIRITKWALDNKIGGLLLEPCAFYMKSPPNEMDDIDCFKFIQKKWGLKNASLQNQ